MAEPITPERIRALLLSATPGPWVAHDCSDETFDSDNRRGWWWVWREDALPYWGGVLEPRGHPPNCVIGSCEITDNSDGEQELADAQLIATTPDLAAAYLDAVGRAEASQAEVERLTRELAEAREHAQKVRAFSDECRQAVDETLRRALVWAIAHHYKVDIGCCACGWAQLGASHPEHVVDMALAAIGLSGCWMCGATPGQFHTQACSVHGRMPPGEGTADQPEGRA